MKQRFYISKQRNDFGENNNGCNNGIKISKSMLVVD